MPTCRHCESRTADADWGLCRACWSRPKVRVLYKPRHNKGPAWEARIMALRRKAQSRQPLFPLE